ncbi:MAG TPA: aminotransferase class I/II-fold pyridoxal phosphate-dependent enzyme [Terriglobales bacterium]|nr:aminotransferase class I/II-fold pyridoxal phosphate-dependent enzyme [Terriglobales bacterium]
MQALGAMDRIQLQQLADDLSRRYAEFQARRLNLDMTRGKPCAEQLALSNGLLEIADYRAADGTDCRNYGGLEGLPEARALFAELLEADVEEVLVGGNSSLAMMHDTIVQALLRPLPGASEPWRGTAPVRFLCPSPGYDRHFAICQYLGIEMIPVAINEEGPDMGEVERLAGGDSSIKGIWCVPKYSNPTGVTFADSVVERLATMPTAAADFRVFWDNAYAVHHLTGAPDRLANLMAACKRAGNDDRVFVFVSTSKISFAGAGVAAMASSAANLRWLKQGLSLQTIGPDKLNQLRHVRFFKDGEGIAAQMRRHAEILKPKFDRVEQVLAAELGERGSARWTKPRGGYFVSLDTCDGCAGEVVAMAAAAGVKLTAAGATFPGGKDPRDRNIRIAPSMPSLSEIGVAMELLAICVQRVAIRKLLD